MTTKRDRDHWAPERIKREREAAGLSQDEFAALLGVTGGAVSQWETGATKPSGVNRAKIARLLLDGRREPSVDDRLNTLDAEIRELRLAVSVLQELVARLAEQSR